MPRPCFKLEIGFPEPLAGVDEAGCAPLAGPVVAAAVILDRDKFPRGIDDSKNLDLKTREALYKRLHDYGAVIGVEGDIRAADINGNQKFNSGLNQVSPSIDTMADLRLRAGVARSAT